MNQIDLSLFAENSHKVPAKMLTTPLSSEQPFKVRDVIGTHVLDAMLILQTYGFFSVFTSLFIDAMMTTKIMDKAYAEGSDAIKWPILAAIGFIYFAAFYFFNQGQTPAMKLMKKRLSVKEHSFEGALKWSLYSLSVIMTFGMTAKKMHSALKENGHGNLTHQDHFYQELMSYKTWAAPDLVDQAECEQPVFENYEEAA
jgi:hypothetical protein